MKRIYLAAVLALLFLCASVAQAQYHYGQQESGTPYHLQGTSQQAAVASPTVISVSPNNGPTAGGTSVTITGTNFASGATVTFGGAAATSVVVVNSTTITSTTPSGSAGAVTVTVIVNGQSGNLSGGFTYNATGGTASIILCPNAGQTGNNANCQQAPTLTFGAQGTNTPSMAVPVSVNNCSTTNIAACSGSGSATLASSLFSITGTNASDFAVSAGTCSSNQVLASGGSCSPTVTFTPTATAGTSESATLTVNYSGGTTPSSTMSLTGTSATVTTFSSVNPTLSSNTNYQLTANLTCSQSCITVPTLSNVDINLNGHTLTYCNTSSSSLVSAVLVTGEPATNLTVHNGYIAEGAGSCTGLTPINGYGSGAMIAATENTVTMVSPSMFNIAITAMNDQRAKAWFYEGQGGTNSSSHGLVHDVSITDNDTYNCDAPTCRAEDQGFPLVEDQTQNYGGSTYYNISSSGGTQGAIAFLAPSTTLENTHTSPGNATITNSNGFANQELGESGIISNNLVNGSGPGGSCAGCRGLQISSAGHAITGAVVTGGTYLTYDLSNNAEYGTPTGTPNGCEIGGTYGSQLNTAGDGLDLSNNTINGITAIATSGACPGAGFSDSGSTNAAGPNVVENSALGCNYTSSSNTQPCVGVRLDSKQYSPYDDYAVTFLNDNIYGDTSAILVDNAGTPARTFTHPTLGKGSNPSSSWVMFSNPGCGGCGVTSGLVTITDPVFTGGVTKSSNNLPGFATEDPSNTSAYLIAWTYTVTVTRSSNGSPVSGATVTFTDKNSTVELSGTTNASGVVSGLLNDTQYQAVSGVYSTLTYSPFSLSVSAAGCTTYTQTGITDSATTSLPITLSGC